eukprot:tig00021135_g18954.t1
MARDQFEFDEPEPRPARVRASLKAAAGAASPSKGKGTARGEPAGAAKKAKQQRPPTRPGTRTSPRKAEEQKKGPRTSPRLKNAPAGAQAQAKPKAAPKKKKASPPVKKSADVPRTGASAGHARDALKKKRSLAAAVAEPDESASEKEDEGELPAAAADEKVARETVSYTYKRRRSSIEVGSFEGESRYLTVERERRKEDRERSEREDAERSLLSWETYGNLGTWLVQAAKSVSSSAGPEGAGAGLDDIFEDPAAAGDEEGYGGDASDLDSASGLRARREREAARAAGEAEEEEEAGALEDEPLELVSPPRRSARGPGGAALPGLQHEDPEADEVELVPPPTPAVAAAIAARTPPSRRRGPPPPRPGAPPPPRRAPPPRDRRPTLRSLAADTGAAGAEFADLLEQELTPGSPHGQAPAPASSASRSPPPVVDTDDDL